MNINISDIQRETLRNEFKNSIINNDLKTFKKIAEVLKDRDIRVVLYYERTILKMDFPQLLKEFLKYQALEKDPDPIEKTMSEMIKDLIGFKAINNLEFLLKHIKQNKIKLSKSSLKDLINTAFICVNPESKIFKSTIELMMKLGASINNIDIEDLSWLCFDDLESFPKRYETIIQLGFNVKKYGKKMVKCAVVNLDECIDIYNYLKKTGIIDMHKNYFNRLKKQHQDLFKKMNMA